MRVLIADHDVEAKQRYRAYLEQHHFEILEAGTVEGALEHLVNFQVDLLLVDLGLARENQWQLIDYIRKDLHHGPIDLPIIILSKIEGVDLQLDYMRHGVNDWLGEPIQPLARLLARIWILLGEKGKADAAIDQP